MCVCGESKWSVSGIAGEQVILSLGYGIDEGLSPSEVAFWCFSPSPPHSQPPNNLNLIEFDCVCVSECVGYWGP